MLRIGILGGSFNPAHQGHIDVSRIAFKKLKLDKVLWIVSPKNPLKEKSLYTPFERRIAQAKKVASKHKYIEVSDIEKTLFEKSSNSSQAYTYKFLERLKTLEPKYELYFIIGSDNLENFHKWNRWKDLLSDHNIVVIERKGSKFRALNSKAGKYGGYLFLNGKTENISSTEIRNS